MTRSLAIGCALILLVVGGCRSNATSSSGARATLAGVPPRFQRIERMLRAGLERVYAQDVAAVRALRNPVVNEGLALLKARIPHDLRRADVPRFLSARAFFGESLKRFVAAMDGGTDAAAFDAVRDLYDATRGWISAYQGLPTETAV